MNLFIGTKVIRAIAMNRRDYNDFRGWELPENEDGDDAGYLVEYLDGGKPNVESYAGYVSWSPEEQFNAAYRPVKGLTFSQALEAIKIGKKVQREGWNGKGMWIAYTPGSTFAKELAREGHADKHRADELIENQIVRLLPHIDMRAADGAMVIGWLASQTDMLAEDWQVIE